MMGQNITGDNNLEFFCEHLHADNMEDQIVLRVKIGKTEEVYVYFYLKEKGWVAADYNLLSYKVGRSKKPFFEPIVCRNKDEVVPAVKKAYARIISQKTEEAKKAYDALVELHKLLIDGNEQEI